MFISKHAGLLLIFSLIFMAFTYSTAAQTPMPDLNGVTIGSSYEAVVSAWGTANRVVGEYRNGCGLLNFRNNLYLANFVAGRLWNLSVQFDAITGPEEGATRKMAQTLKKQLLPPDASFIKHSRQRNGPGWDEFYLYRSRSLIGLFQPNDFYDLDRVQNVPGEFLVTVSFNEQGKATYLSIGVGNNP